MIGIFCPSVNAGVIVLCFEKMFKVKCSWIQKTEFLKKYIPEVYLLHKDIFFEESDCPNFETTQRICKILKLKN